MAPAIMVLCIIGAYSVNNNMFDVYVMLAAGISGYVLKKCAYPLAPLLLAFVLTPRLEQSFTQSFQVSHGHASIFFTRPISLLFLICILFFTLVPILKKFREN